MLMVRLQRVGKKKEPAFRLVLTDSRNSTKSGRFLHILGSYNPKAHTSSFNKEQILQWVSKGARLSGTVNNLLIKEGVIKGQKVHVSPNIAKTTDEKSQEQTASLGEVKESAKAKDTLSENSIVVTEGEKGDGEKTLP